MRINIPFKYGLKLQIKFIHNTNPLKEIKLYANTGQAQNRSNLYFGTL
jgi:hypothetical protein